MNILITGAGGFVGKHLLAHLADLEPSAETSLHGTIFGKADADQFKDQPDNAPKVQLWPLDLRDPAGVHEMMAQVQPDRIFHLAGQAFIPQSFRDPWETLDINIHGTLNLLQAIHDLTLPTRILVVGSAEVYGPARSELLPLNEDTPFIPSSPYSVSKIAQDMLALQYTRAYNVYAVRVRPFNHIGPGQNERFAVADWASQIAAAEAGQREPVVYVGNLSAARDFTDVRDVVRAYALALESCPAGEVYNVCSGQAFTMQRILEILVGMSKRPIEIRVAPDRFRPVEIPTLYGDYTRLQRCTDWQPQISIEQSLSDVLNEWRQRISTPLTS